MAQNRVGLHSAMTEASSQSTATQIKERSTLTWAKLVTQNQKQQKTTSIHQVKPKIRSAQVLTEQGGRIEHVTKRGYLDLRSEKSQNQLPSVDLLSLSDKNQLNGVRQGIDCPPNLNSDHERGETREVTNNSNTHDHAVERCWLRYPRLGSKREGCGAAVIERNDDTIEKRKMETCREGEKEIVSNGSSSSTDVTKRLDKIEAALISCLQGLKGPLVLPHDGPHKIKKSDLFDGISINKTRPFGIEPNLESNDIVYVKPQPSPRCTYRMNCYDSLLEKPIGNKCLTIGSTIINSPNNCTKWILDSGATDHMTGNQNLLKHYRPISGD